ncbi:MAG: NTP transferase domain-containing protein [Lachnospiraceae bacterium]|nr:NTP transferase domain-containing protein [Lachnospiraceae bacterium]
MRVYGVIMAGGGGTRFWPLSRRQLPKQFLSVTGRDALINETFDRLAEVAPPENIFVVTGTAYAQKAMDIMNGRIGSERILEEPQARGTAACIGYAAMELLHKYGDGVMCIMPSDHYIEDEAGYCRVLRRAVELAAERDALVTVGIKPQYPATGYGYIRSSAVMGTDGRPEDYRKIEEFVEKPPRIVAQEYLSLGGYAWNSGMFVWKASVILDCYRRLLPDIYEYLSEISRAFGKPEEKEVLGRVYPKIPRNTIDYGIMERAEGVLMLEGDFGWNDVGSLDALALFGEADAHGNVCMGESLMIDTGRTISYSSGRLIAAVGVEDLMIVETPDSILVCPKNRAQDVKKVVEELQAKGYEKYL